MTFWLVKSSSPCLCVHRSRFSPSVRPVTVSVLPSIILFFSRYARTSVARTCYTLGSVELQVRGPTRDATELVDVHHDVLATGLQVSDERCAIRNCLEVVNCERYAHRMGNSYKV